MKIIVFTDLDATLLDSRTYSWKAASEALEALRRREAEIVLVSSKTFAEMVPLHSELGFRCPFVVENGGGIAFPVASLMGARLPTCESQVDSIHFGRFRMLSLGTRYDELVRALAEVSSEVGSTLRGFASMSDAEVAALTGLSLEMGALARQRHYDEPFIIAEGDRCCHQDVVNAAEARGLAAVQGGRFWHLIGHGGKGSAAAILLELYRQTYPRLLSVGLGDSPNDFPFLELVDIPVLVGPAAGAIPCSQSGNWLAHARLVPTQGPEGWNQAILAILSELQEAKI